MLKTDDVDQHPPWHPFELNSELTLQSIVKDGYRFAGMPCGQVQYIKNMGNTTIQYEVEVDCSSYEGKYDPHESLIEEDTIPPSKYEPTSKEIAERRKKYLIWKKEMIANHYYPWNINDIKDCYQNIWARFFTLNLGETVDRNFIKSYVRENGGRILNSSDNWDLQNGGTFFVEHVESNLYFQCSIEKSHPDERLWELRIVRTIPKLDQKKILKEKIWKEKKAAFYDWQN
jgi:hypothetical protein